jgi:hypothetical protein
MRIITLIVLLYSFLSFGQKERGYAQQLRDGNLHLGITAGLQIDRIINEATPGYDFEYNVAPRAAIGLNWNYAATGRFLFGFDLAYENLKVRSRGEIPETLFNTSSSIPLSSNRTFDIYTINFRFEYVHKIAPDHYVSLGLNINNRWRIKDDLIGIGQLFVVDDGSMNNVEIVKPDRSNVFIRTPVSLTYTYKNEKVGAFSLRGMMSWEEGRLVDDFIFIRNADTQEVSISQHAVTTRFFNISISWFPSKSIFKKSK